MTVRVLVADDGSAAAMALIHMMTREGYAVRAARGPEATLAAAVEDRPDIVVLDAAPGGRDGYALCRRLRDDPRLAGLKIVVLSAPSAIAFSVSISPPRADALVRKPFSCRDLAFRIRALADGVDA